MTLHTAFLPLLLLISAKTCAGNLPPLFEFHQRSTAPIEKKQRNAQTEQRYSGTITAVSDGDTLRLTDTHGRKRKIRLAYIDAPELQQVHGHASRTALENAVLRQTVEVHVFDTDRYRREVAQVRLHGQDINLLQILQGHAWHYASIAKRKQNKADYAAYARAQTHARNERLGLWQNRAAQAPWAFRKTEREKQEPVSVYR